jgi:hypothetical protein
VEKWVKKHLQPLSCAEDVSFDTWLDGTNYPDWRKEELRQIDREFLDLLQYSRKDKHFRDGISIKSFVKDEHYTDWKHARNINARHDYYKITVGRFYKAIENVIYQLPWFIKHVPVADRPQYIKDYVYRVGSKYLCTDYTSFEAWFVEEIMDATEFVLYRHMLQNVNEGPAVVDLIEEVQGGPNRCKFKELYVQINATRMSGEMCTSLGNGFSNLMFMLFMCKLKKCKDVVGVVEGDDGLFTMVGSAPTTEDFAKLGLRIKLEVHDRLEEASFCGMIFDIDDEVIVTDVRKVLASFGWSSSQYTNVRLYKKRALLRCKALSLAYQYPRCPIVWSLARNMLRLTSDCKMNLSKMIDRMQGNLYRRQILLDAINVESVPQEPPLNTRFLVERLYGVSVEYQLEIEKYFNSLTSIGALQCPYIDDIMDDKWKKYAETYVLPYTRISEDFLLPQEVLPWKYVDQKVCFDRR